MRLQWHFGLGRELGYAFWALTFFEAVFGAYISIWPLWIERLGAPISIVGLVLGSAGLIRPLVIGPGSWLVDRFNTRRLLFVARSLSVGGLLVAAFADAWPLLLLTVVTGAIGELVFPAIQTYVADHAGENSVHAFTMVITVGPSVALVATPLVSGFLISIAGMRAAFVLAALLTVAGMVFVSRMSFARSRHEGDADQTASYRRAWQTPAIKRIILFHGCTIISLAIGSSLIPNFLESERGFEPALVSILSSGAAVGTISYGIIASRNRHLRSAPILAAVVAASCTALGYLLFATQSSLPLVAVAFLLRGGLFSAWVFYLAAMGNVAPKYLRPRAFAIVEIVGGSAISFGPIIAAQLWLIDPSAPFLAASALSAITVAWVLRSGLAIGKSASTISPLPEEG
jgi:MFS family permease